jgi:hypothetical protein
VGKGTGQVQSGGPGNGAESPPCGPTRRVASPSLTSLLLWEPARLKPQASGLQVQIAVHVQRRDRGSPRGGSADDCLPVARPPKVLFPNLGARVEEADLNSGPGVDADRPIPLGQVARGACQRPIAERIGAAARAGDDVFQVKAMAAHALWGVTVFTAPAGALLHTSAQAGRGGTSASCRLSSLKASPTVGAAPLAGVRCPA